MVDEQSGAGQEPPQPLTKEEIDVHFQRDMERSRRDLQKMLPSSDFDYDPKRRFSHRKYPDGTVFRQYFRYDPRTDSFPLKAFFSSKSSDIRNANRRKQVLRYKEEIDNEGNPLMHEVLTVYTTDDAVAMMSIGLLPDGNNTYALRYDSTALTHVVHTYLFGESGTSSFGHDDYFVRINLNEGGERVEKRGERAYATRLEKDEETGETYIVLRVSYGQEETVLRVAKTVPKEKQDKMLFTLFPSIQFDEDPYNVDPRDDKWVNAEWQNIIGLRMTHSVPIGLDQKDATQDHFVS